MSQTIVTAHNLSQTIAWISIFVGLTVKTYQNPYGSFYNPRVFCPEVIQLYIIVQNLQILDAVFALLGWTRAKVMAVVPQTLMRCLFANITLQLCQTETQNEWVNYYAPWCPHYPIIFIALFCFSIVEINRYGVSFCKGTGLIDTTIGRVFSNLRWNTFLICYPLGATCDCLAGVFTIKLIEGSDLFYYFRYFLIMLPVAYLAVFPGIFRYLLQQRKAFYNEKKKTD